jgi:hypothetical protein
MVRAVPAITVCVEVAVFPPVVAVTEAVPTNLPQKLAVATPAELVNTVVELATVEK